MYEKKIKYFINNLKKLVFFLNDNENNKKEFFNYKLDPDLLNLLEFKWSKNEEDKFLKIKEKIKIIQNNYIELIKKYIEINFENFKNYLQKENINISNKEKLVNFILEEKLNLIKKTDKTIKNGYFYSLFQVILINKKYDSLKELLDNINSPEEFFKNLKTISIAEINKKLKLENNINDIKLLEFIQSLIIIHIINFPNLKQKIKKFLINNNNINITKILKEIYFLNKNNLKYNKKILKKFEKLLYEENNLNNYIDWIQSGYFQGISLKNILNNKNNFQIYDEKEFIDHKLKQHIINLIENEKKYLKNININKWNPADIYLIDKNLNLDKLKEELLKTKTIQEFNKYFNSYVLSNQIIPFSIKKYNNKEKFIIVRNNLTSEEFKKRYKELEIFNIKEVIGLFDDTFFNNKYIKLCNKNKKICFELRTFSSTNILNSFSGEITEKGTIARHGKIGEKMMLNILKDLVTNILEDNKYKDKNEKYNLNKLKKELEILEKENLSIVKEEEITAEKIFKLIIDNEKLLKQINPEAFKNKTINNITIEKIYEKMKENKSWTISKYKSLLVLNYFLKLKNLQLFNKLTNFLYLYSTSQFDFSSIYFKITNKESFLQDFYILLKLKNIDIDFVTKNDIETIKKRYSNINEIDIIHIQEYKKIINDNSLSEKKVNEYNKKLEQ